MKIDLHDDLAQDNVGRPLRHSSVGVTGKDPVQVLSVQGENPTVLHWKLGIFNTGRMTSLPLSFPGLVLLNILVAASIPGYSSPYMPPVMQSVGPSRVPLININGSVVTTELLESTTSS